MEWKEAERDQRAAAEQRETERKASAECMEMERKQGRIGWIWTKGFPQGWMDNGRRTTRDGEKVGRRTEREGENVDNIMINKNKGKI